MNWNDYCDSLNAEAWLRTHVRKSLRRPRQNAPEPHEPQRTRRDDSTESQPAVENH